MKLQSDRVILICLCTTVLFATSRNWEITPLLPSRPIRYSRDDPFHFISLPSLLQQHPYYNRDTKWGRQDVPVQYHPLEAHALQENNSFQVQNYTQLLNSDGFEEENASSNLSTTLESPLLWGNEIEVSEGNTTGSEADVNDDDDEEYEYEVMEEDELHEDQQVSAEEKKTKPKFKGKNKYKGGFPLYPLRPLLPPPPPGFGKGKPGKRPKGKLKFKPKPKPLKRPNKYPHSLKGPTETKHPHDHDHYHHHNSSPLGSIDIGGGMEIQPVPLMPVLYLIPEEDLHINPQHHHYSNDSQEEEEEETPQETTTLAPFTIADVKVPAPFLRIEYMICYCFLGLMYGLGFFVLFQSIIVPVAKVGVILSYLILLKYELAKPVTFEQAIAQLPPT